MPLVSQFESGALAQPRCPCRKLLGLTPVWESSLFQQVEAPVLASGPQPRPEQPSHLALGRPAGEPELLSGRVGGRAALRAQLVHSSQGLGLLREQGVAYRARVSRRKTLARPVGPGCLVREPEASSLRPFEKQPR